MCPGAVNDLAQFIRAARGEIEADLLLRGGRVVDVFTHCTDRGDGCRAARWTSTRSPSRTSSSTSYRRSHHLRCLVGHQPGERQRDPRQQLAPAATAIPPPMSAGRSGSPGPVLRRRGRDGSAPRDGDIPTPQGELECHHDSHESRLSAAASTIPIRAPDARTSLRRARSTSSRRRSSSACTLAVWRSSGAAGPTGCLDQPSAAE
jgi:hypothetical protein